MRKINEIFQEPVKALIQCTIQCTPTSAIPIWWIQLLDHDISGEGVNVEKAIKVFELNIQHTDSQMDIKSIGDHIANNSLRRLWYQGTKCLNTNNIEYRLRRRMNIVKFTSESKGVIDNTFNGDLLDLTVFK